MTQEEKDKLVAVASRTFLGEWDNWAPVYENIEEGYDFLGGRQYSPAMEKWYTKKRRPVNVFNMYQPVFTQYMGSFLQNQTKNRVNPSRGGDPFVAERIEDLFDHYAMSEGTTDEFSRCLLSGLIRLGYMYAEWTDRKEIDGSLLFENVDEFDIIFDNRARHPLLDDAEYMFRSKWLTTDKIINLWPQHRTKLTNFLRDDELSRFTEAAAPDVAKSLLSPLFVDKGLYRVAEFHYFEFENVEVVIDVETQESEILTLEGKRRDLFLQSNPGVRIINRVERVKKVCEIIPGLSFWLDGKTAELQDGTFDYVNYSAFHFAKKTIDSYGLHKNSKGPQKQYNDTENVMLDIFNKQSMAGTTVKPEWVINYKELTETGQEPGFMALLKAHAPADTIKKQPTPDIPAGGMLLADRYRELFHFINNARQNFMGGSETKNEAASLFAQRVKETEKGTLVSDRAFKSMKKRVFEKALRLLQINLTFAKYWLITQDINADKKDTALNAEAAQRILNDFKTGEFSVKVDDMTRNPTARQQRFNMKKELAEWLIPILGAQAVEFRDWLEEGDLGDMQKWIEKIEAAVAAQADAAEEQESIQNAQSLIEAAKGKQSLDEGNAA